MLIELITEEIIEFDEIALNRSSTYALFAASFSYVGRATFIKRLSSASRFSFSTITRSLDGIADNLTYVSYASDELNLLIVNLSIFS